MASQIKRTMVFAGLLVLVGTVSAYGPMMQNGMGGRYMGMGGRNVGMMGGASVVPETYRKLSNPVPATTEAVADGARYYQANCFVCHGQGGRGDGPAAKGLSLPPANLKIVMETARANDGYLMWTISQGRGVMPAFGQALSEEARWKIIRFLWTL